MKCNEVKIFDEICVLSLIYSYVAVCRFYAVRCFIIICFSVLFSNYSTYVFLIFFLFSFFCFVSLFSVLFILCFCIVCVLFLLFLYSSLFLIFLHMYRPLSPAGNPVAVNKCHIISSLETFVRKGRCLHNS